MMRLEKLSGWIGDLQNDRAFVVRDVNVESVSYTHLGVSYMNVFYGLIKIIAFNSVLFNSEKVRMNTPSFNLHVINPEYIR